MEGKGGRLRKQVSIYIGSLLPRPELLVNEPVRGYLWAGNLGYEVSSIVVRPRTVMTKLWNLLTVSLSRSSAGLCGSYRMTLGWLLGLLGRCLKVAE